MSDKKSVGRITRSRGEGSKVTVLSAKRADSSQQLEVTDTLFEGVDARGLTVLAPPYDPGNLYRLVETSNMLPQCIDAYVSNTVGTGWEVGPVSKNVTIRPEESEVLQSMIDSANAEESLSTVMQAVIRDRETYGYGFLEVIRDRRGRISLFRHARSAITRLTKKHPTAVEVAFDVVRGPRTTKIKELRRFRTFVQRDGGRVVYFKEFGDPRDLDYETGKFAGEEGYRKGYSATEIKHFRNPSDEEYGKPRWISQTPSVLGSRESEELNLQYFSDNMIPPILMTVSGGRLTQGSYKDLRAQIEKQGVGKGRQNRFVIVEAIPESDSLEGGSGSVDIKVERLAENRQSDSLFSEYDSANQAKVRSSYRLPPISVGQAQDHNFATANVSAFIAETQVFAPARQAIDEILNRQIFGGTYGCAMTTVMVVSRTPLITSPDQMVKTLTAANVMGAITPRSAQSVLNKVLQIEIPTYPAPDEEGYEEWMDKPIVFATRGANTHGEQAVKTNEVKTDEQTGDIGGNQPKHGSE